MSPKEDLLMTIKTPIFGHQSGSLLYAPLIYNFLIIGHISTKSLQTQHLFLKKL